LQSQAANATGAIAHGPHGGQLSLVSMDCASKDSTGADLAVAPAFLALARAPAPRGEVSWRRFVVPL